MTLIASVDAPVKQAAAIKKTVWFTGTTALKEGQGVCYVWNYSSTTVPATGQALFDGRRSNYVELPSVTNARHFAGVCAGEFAGRAGGRSIDINLPSSVCNILTKASTTIGVGILTCEAGGTYAGYFRYAGFEGEGSAVPLQTINNATIAGKCQALLQTGNPSGLVEVVQIVDSTAFTLLPDGVSYLIGAACTTGAPTCAAFADPTIEGIRKKIDVITTAITTNEAVVTLVTSGVQIDDTSALATITLGPTSDVILLEGRNGVWHTLATAATIEG